MGMIERELHGPSESSEQSSASIHRSVRTGFQTLRHTLLNGGAIALMTGFAAGVLIEPALTTLLTPAAGLYSWVVLRQRRSHPLRLPWSSKALDYNDPMPGKRQPRRAAGLVYLGICHITGKELWISADDAKQHISVPGITGAGKSTVLKGIIFNALAFGSGVVLVDGKGDRSFVYDVQTMARILNREKDMRVISFAPREDTDEHHPSDSQTFNPFAWASADAMREMLVAQIEHNPEGGDGNKVFMQRAAALLGANAPVLVWMRDKHGVPIDIDSIRMAAELESVAALAFERRFRRRDPETGAVDYIDVPDMPEALIAPLRSYLGDTGGYDMAMHKSGKPSDKATEQHSYVSLHFTATFTQLGVSLGHIFRCSISDVDMRDVALNRRILVVVLPALWFSGETTMALGKLVVAALRNMMAQTLGGRMEGSHDDLMSGAMGDMNTPSFIFYDELAAYASAGLKEQLQQGRGLGFSFVLGWHDIEGLKSKIGEVAYTVLNNANLQLILRQNAGGLNRQHIEQSMGDANVTQTGSFLAGSMGYVAGNTAEVKTAKRVNWLDTRSLLPGEGIVTMGNNRVYSKLFYPDLPKPVGTDGYRLNRPVALPPPPMGYARKQAAEVKAMRDALLQGGVPSPKPTVTPVYSAMLKGFEAALTSGRSLVDAADAAISAISQVPLPAPVPEPAPTAGAPITDFTPTLRAVAATPVTEGDEFATVGVLGAGAASLLATFQAIEEAIGRPPEEAEQEARRALAMRDEALDTTSLPQPPPTDAKKLRAAIEGLMTEIGDDALAA